MLWEFTFSVSSLAPMIPGVLLIPLIERKVILPVLSFANKNNIFLGLLLIDYSMLLFSGNIEIGFLDINESLLILFKF
jgi:hypothetical protein